MEVDGLCEGVRAALTAAQRLYDVEDWDGAERILRRAAAREDPVPWQVNVLLGNVLAKQKRHDEAIAYLRRATEQDPSHEMVSLVLFHALFDAGRVAEALGGGHRFLASAGDRGFAEYREVVQAVADHVEEAS